MFDKSKKARRKWWNSLSSKEQNQYITKCKKAKNEKRRQKSLKVMKKHGDKYKCSECYHRKTESCTDDLPNGCEYWVNLDDGILREVA